MRYEGMFGIVPYDHRLSQQETDMGRKDTDEARKNIGPEGAAKLPEAKIPADKFDRQRKLAAAYPAKDSVGYSEIIQQRNGDIFLPCGDGNLMAMPFKLRYRITKKMNVRRMCYLNQDSHLTFPEGPPILINITRGTIPPDG
jgi:hypothetical protein